MRGIGVLRLWLAWSGLIIVYLHHLVLMVVVEVVVTSSASVPGYLVNPLMYAEKLPVVVVWETVSLLLFQVQKQKASGSGKNVP